MRLFVSVPVGELRLEPKPGVTGICPKFRSEVPVYACVRLRVSVGGREQVNIFSDSRQSPKYHFDLPECQGVSKPMRSIRRLLAPFELAVLMVMSNTTPS